MTGPPAQWLLGARGGRGAGGADPAATGAARGRRGGSKPKGQNGGAAAAGAAGARAGAGGKPAAAIDNGHFWSPEEQQTLEALLRSFEARQGLSGLQRYTLIAAELPAKSIRDVALRVKWMSRKETGKRKKVPGGEEAPKPAGKRPAEKAGRGGAGGKGGAGGAVGGGKADATGTTEQYLFHNLKLIEEIKRNMAACKVAENTEVLGDIRDHIMAILASMGSMPGIMRQMPPLPIQLDLELANRILPPPKPPNPQAASH